MVCHQAAQLDVRVSIRDPLFDADVNIQGSLRLINLCVKHGVRKFIFSSTGGAIYGEDCIPADETMAPRPISGYGVAKLSVEHYLYCFYKNHGLDYVALRYANVYGPRQNAHGEAGVVAIFSSKMLSGMPVTINGDGNQTRDFVFVEDVVSANIASYFCFSSFSIQSTACITTSTVEESSSAKYDGLIKGTSILYFFASAAISLSSVEITIGISLFKDNN